MKMKNVTLNSKLNLKNHINNMMQPKMVVVH